MNQLLNQTKFGFVAVFGATNSGKSTLVNYLVGHKVAIVSHKVQTTRRRLIGLRKVEQTQIAFIDTPGLFKAQEDEKFDQGMVKAAVQAHQDADITMLIIDANNPKLKLLQNYLQSFKNCAHPIILILNKIDLIAKTQLLMLIEQLNQIYSFTKIFLISALMGDGCEDLLKYLCHSLPQGPWHYPSEQKTDASLSYIAAEITREKIYQFLHQELPYAIHVETEKFETLNHGSFKISQVILVERANQKSIILGQNGQMIKRIGQTARHEIGRVLKRKIHLSLFIKIQKNWRSKVDILNYYGFD